MKIAYTMGSGRGDTDLLLDRFARHMSKRGLSAVGTVQVNTRRADKGPCDMDVRVLPDGPQIRISQSLGIEARGCRLDPDALERAVALVRGSLRPGVDCMIVNKFGKHEAEGRGFREVIAEALALEIPVLVGLNALNEQAFLSFVGTTAEALPPDIDHLSRWVESPVQQDDGRPQSAAAC